MYFSTGSWTYKRFHRVMARKLEWEPKKKKWKRESEGRRGNSPLPLLCSLPNFLDERARKRLLRRLLWGAGGAYEWGRGGGVLSGRLQYTCLPFITGLFIWGLGVGLSETGTVSTDLLGSFVLLGCELGGDPTKVKSTLDTELWKNVVQFGTLGYFTSETKKKMCTIWFQERSNRQQKNVQPCLQYCC